LLLHVCDVVVVRCCDLVQWLTAEYVVHVLFLLFTCNVFSHALLFLDGGDCRVKLLGAVYVCMCRGLHR
jgi:hypothetical protein